MASNQKNISAEFSFQHHYVEVFGSKMHYIDEGEGDPILFLHGNPTSSYLWRNIIPHLQPYGRTIAVDLIGMGKSEKPDIGYRFADHARYLDEFITKLNLKNITLVVHDWGSALGFYYLTRYEENVKGIAFMEAMVKTITWKDMNFIVRFMFKRMRHPEKGYKMIVKNNFFIEKMLPMMTVRKLTDEEKSMYAEPYLEESSRKPMLVWPSEIPIDGEPADVEKIVNEYREKLKKTNIPKLLLWVKPGVIIKGEKEVKQIQDEFPNTETVFIGKGKHYIQEDHPDKISATIAQWYRRL